MFIQLDSDNSNSDNSKSLLIRSNIYFSWCALLLIFTSLIRTPVNSNHFPFSLGLRINGVQLYMADLKFKTELEEGVLGGGRFSTAILNLEF